jgi:hypothetical protein
MNWASDRIKRVEEDRTMIKTWYEYEDRQDGSFMFQHRTDDDELITEIYYGYNEVEAIKKFEKLLKEITTKEEK